MNNIKYQLGAKIKMLRKQKGLTQERFSELVNRSKNHISKIELGEANPPLSLLLDIAQTLEVDVSDLFTFDTNVVKKLTLKEIKDKLLNIENVKVLKMIYKFYICLLSDNLL